MSRDKFSCLCWPVVYVLLFLLGGFHSVLDRSHLVDVGLHFLHIFNDGTIQGGLLFPRLANHFQQSSRPPHEKQCKWCEDS